MYDVKCPYCGHLFDVCTDDGAHCTQDAYEEEFCPECEKVMMISTTWEAYREATVAKCLNSDNPTDSDHDWQDIIEITYTQTKPIFKKVKKCRACKKTKPLIS